ncbi:MAG: single-stranded DNA-binding protein [Firmicutes bacterium]|nr:single-stranded DNA-binding protein [Bacillota bacterium]
MNKAILIGRLTKDPEQQTTPNGIPVTRFRIAVNRNFVNAAGEREADFLNIVTWRNLAENCFKFLKKGSLVGVSGRIEVSEYEKDGQRRIWTDIVADDVRFLTPIGGDRGSDGFVDEGGGARPASSGGGAKAKLTPVEDDELPF